jgi:hypothetical protein
MLKKIFFAAVAALLPTISNAGCSLSGYVVAVQYSMVNGYTYMISAELYEYHGGPYIGSARIANANTGTGAPLGDLEDKRDTKAAKTIIESAYQNYQKITIWEPGTQGKICAATPNENFFITASR